MKSGEEELTLFQFIYKNKCFLIILYPCRHPVMLQGLHPESDKEGVNPLQAVPQQAERLCLVGGMSPSCCLLMVNNGTDFSILGTERMGLESCQ